MHRFFAECREEPKRQQVQITVYKAVESHKLRRAILTGLMMYDFLADLVKTGIFRQIWDVAMHLAIDLDILHDCLAVCLQTTVEIMQILDTTDLAGRSIEQFRGKCL